MSALIERVMSVARIWLVILTALLALGMGSLGGEEPTTIPEPADDFSATVIDQHDVSSDITLFSLDGQTFLSGKHGGATVSIPFKNVQEIDFYSKGDDVFARVILQNAPQVELSMDKSRIFYGRLPYGIFSIKIQDIRRITILGLTKHEE